MITFDFFTADTHSGSERTLSLSRRPFNSVKEMDETIIKNFNHKMNSCHNLLHLGDFGDYSKLKEINANVYLLMGNYEVDEMKEKFNNNSGNYLKGLENIPNILLASHEPEKLYKFINELTKSKPLGIFGHIHGRQKVKRFGLDVGVDAHFFNPVSMEDIDFYFNAIHNFYDNNVFI